MVLPTSRVTMREVAQAANTSTAVVSYVVNDGPRVVAATTRQRVLDAIEQLGYQPDRVAQGLARGKSHTCGLIVPDITNPFFASLARALEDELFHGGRSLLLGNSAETALREDELISSFLQQRITALFFIGTDASLAVETARKQNIPVVLLDRTHDSLDVASVAIDNVAAAKAATQHLLGLGYDDITHVGGPSELAVAQDRLRGFEEAIAHAPRAVASRTVMTPFTRVAGLEVGRQMFGGAPPRAIFASNEQQAIGLLRAARERGLRVPEDVAIVAIDGTGDSEFTAPQLSCVVQPVEEIAQEAVGLLDTWPHATGMHVECSFELVVRESCGATPPSRAAQSH
jgi:LacI family transcriptional regulator